MNYDQVLEHVGQFGLWQILVCLLASLAAMAEAFMTLQFTFIGYSDYKYFRCNIEICQDQGQQGFNPDFLQFAIPNDTNEEDHACLMYKVQDPNAGCIASNFLQNETEVCSHHVYDSDNASFGYSLVEELDLPPCSDNAEWPLNPVVSQMALINMGYMFGLLIGSLVFGLVSDKFGRRIALLSAAILSGAISLSMSFVRNFWLYFVLRFVLGIVAKGLFMLAFMICVEISGVKYKTPLGILIQVPFAIGEMLVGLIAYLAQNWTTLEQIMSGLVLGLAILWYFMPESPRWLLSQNKYQEALKVLTNGSKLNRRPLPDGFLRYDNNSATFENAMLQEREELGLTSLFKTKHMTTITLVMFLNWITATLCYYGLTMSSVNLSDDIYVNFVLSAVIEIPSYIFCVLVMDRIGRKPILTFSQLLAGLTCIVAAFLSSDDLQGLRNGLTLAGKFGCSASFAIVYLYTAELYPTVIRNSALGAASMVARIGGIAAPLLAGMSDSLVPLIIMGSSSLLAGILALLLPETLGAKLPETITEVKNLYDNSKSFFAWKSKPDDEVTDPVAKTEVNVQKTSPPTAKITPIQRPKPFNIPSIVIDPGTPKSPMKKPLIEIHDEKVEEAPQTIQVEDEMDEPSRRFSQVPPAAKDDPNAVQKGKFGVSPTPSKEKGPSVTPLEPAVSIEPASNQEPVLSPGSSLASETSLPTIEAPGTSVIQAQNNELVLSPGSLSVAAEKSRRFSQLPPASQDSPGAVKLGSKFTMIPHQKAAGQVADGENQQH